MATARRWYFYGVAFISQMMMFAGVLGLTHELLAARGVGLSNRALYIALIVVGLPIYVLHWGLAQRAVRHGDDERGATLRKVYFYAAQAVTLGAALNALYQLLNVLLGGTGTTTDLVEQLAMLVVSLLFWAYHFRLARADAALEREVGGGAAARRFFQFGLSAAGLWIWAVGVHDLVLHLVGYGTSGSSAATFWQTGLAHDVSRLLVGLLAWLPAWIVLQRRVVQDDDEQRSVIRKFYLYAVVFAGAALALFSFAAWLQAFIKILFGEPVPSTAALTQGTTDSLLTSLLGAVLWAYHARVLDTDTRFAEAPRQASIRRLYHYVVAAISLTALIVGVALTAETLLRIALDWRPEFASAGWWRDPLAWGIAALVVGLPVWLRAWLRMQAVALALTEAGREERRATLRKIYLYGVALAGALVVLFNLASAAYQILQVLLGESNGLVLAGNIAGALVNGVVAGVAWLYHIFAIQRDSALARQTPGALALSPLTIGIADSTSDFGASLRARLEHDLPNAHLIAIGETPAGADAATPQPDLIVVALPSLLSARGAGTGLASSGGRVLVVPLARDGLTILGQSSAPTVSQAVAQASQWIRLHGAET